MNKNEIIEKLNLRYAVKKFDSEKKINQSDWDFLSEVLRLSPSSYGLQPWKFLIIQNNELRQKLKNVSYNQSQVTDCSHFVVIATLKKLTEIYVQKYIDKMVEVRSVESSSLDGLKKVIIGDLVTGSRSKEIKHWSHRQAYIAMGNLMNAAALLDIDTCPLEGIEPQKYDQILDLESTEYGVVAAVACGYRHKDDKYQHVKKVRFASEDIFSII